MPDIKHAYWGRELAGRRTSRRRFLATGGSVAAGTTAAALLASCSSSGKSSPSSKSPGSAAGSPSAPRRGGVLLTLYEYDPPTLDVHTQSAAQAQMIATSIYSGIVKLTWKTPWTVSPDLAKSWEMTPDGLQYTFRFNSGVKWSDGSDFSSADAAFNLQKATSSSVAPKSARLGHPLAPVLDKVSTPDASTLVVQLKAPFPALLEVLGNNGSKIFKREIYEKDAQETQFVGTGPFTMKQYTKGQSAEYVRNPNYFKPGLPYLDGLKRLYIPSIPAEVSALSTGQIMVNTLWPGLSPSQLKTIQTAAGNKADVQSLAENSLERLFVNVTKPPFNDARVRRAVNLAIDRQDVLARALEGAGVIGVLDPREAGDTALTAEEIAKLPGYRQPKDQDYADAKKLLAAAGHPDGLDFDFTARSAASYIAVAQVVQQSLAKAGLRAKLQQVESSAGVVMQTQGKYDLMNIGSGSGFHDPFLTLNTEMGAGDEFVLLNDPNITGAIQRGLTTLDPAERKRIARDIQMYIATKDTASFPIAWDTAGIVVWRQMQNYYGATDIEEGMDFEDVWLMS